MNRISTDRRLAAILVADIAGYSALMGADEDATVRELKAHQGVVLPMVGESGGRVIDIAGDGILAEFASVLNAMKCALAIQEVMRSRNSGVDSARQMLFRIGVNIGDVVYDAQRIYGDGVNIAARLESLAHPGGICISGKVFDEVRGRFDLEYEDIGEQSLKNIAHPVRAFYVHQPGAAPTNTVSAAKAIPPVASTPVLPQKPSIAVLPFANRSGDIEQEYFIDGIAEDVILMLSRISDIFVIARSSSFSFKGQSVTAQQAAHELGVSHILEGSARRSANQIRITAQLVEGGTGATVWAERYDRELHDIFAVQDEVTDNIVSALSVTLTEKDKKRLMHRRDVDMRAYELFQRGRVLFHQTQHEANLQARSVLTDAIDIVPDYSAALAYLALTYMVDHVNQWSDGDVTDSLQYAHQLALNAVTADSAEPSAHLALAATELWLRQHGIAIAEARIATELDPNYAHAMFVLGSSLTYAGRAAEAIPVIEKAMRLDPRHADTFTHWLAVSRFHVGDFQTSADTLRRRLRENPNSDISRMLLAACLGHLGRGDEAQHEWSQVLDINPEFSISYKRRILPYKNPDDFETIVKGLQNAGIATDR